MVSLLHKIFKATSGVQRGSGLTEVAVISTQNWTNFLSSAGIRATQEAWDNWAPVSCITTSSAGRSTVSCSLISEASTISECRMCYCVLEEPHRAGKQAGSMLPVSMVNDSHSQTRTTKPLLLSLLFKPKGQAKPGHFIYLGFPVAHPQLLCWIPANR